MCFKDRIELLILEYADGSQTKLSQESGIPIATINGWLTKGRLPRFEQIIQLSKFFNVSADYLLGLTEESTPFSSNENIIESFSVEDYRLIKDISALTYDQKILLGKILKIVKESNK